VTANVMHGSSGFSALRPVMVGPSHGSNEARVGGERDVGGGVSKGDHRTAELVALEKTYVFLMRGPAFEGTVRQRAASRRVTEGSSQERDGGGVDRDRVTHLPPG
jgi:hypothetical protein